MSARAFAIHRAVLLLLDMEREPYPNPLPTVLDCYIFDTSPERIPVSSRMYASDTRDSLQGSPGTHKPGCRGTRYPLGHTAPGIFLSPGPTPVAPHHFRVLGTGAVPYLIVKEASDIGSPDI